MNNNNQLQQKERQNALLQKDITDTVMTRLEGLQKEGVVIPPNYNAQNALKSAFFALSDANGVNLLEKCTQNSIANSLLDMVIQGLSPAKTQCYFIPYGNTCKMKRSYFGTMKVLKSLPEIKDVDAAVIYDGDEFDFDIIDGRKFLVKHKSSFKNQDNDIVGVYCVITRQDGTKPIEVMTRKQIETSWKQSKMYGKVHNNFPQEMAKRTVINLAAKPYINSSNDFDAVIESINRSTESDEDSRIDKANAIDVEIKEQANTQEFVEEDIPQVPYAGYEPTTEPQQAPQATCPQAWQQASQQAQAQPTPTTESQPQEVMWNL